MSSCVFKLSCLFALSAIAGCGQRDPRSAPKEPGLDECLGQAFDPGDPHSQGEMLGVGFQYNKRFVPVDGLTLAGLRDARHEKITARVVDHGLVGSITGDGWIGASVPAVMHCKNGGTRTVSLVVHGVQQQPKAGTIAPAGASGPAWFYDLQIDLRDGSPPRNACGDRKQGHDLVFALPGTWKDGAYVASDTDFSFACASLGAALCLRQGYAEDARQLDGHPDLFQACGRMMRADYCGTGESFTREGTLITLWDSTIPPLSGDGVRSFEGAWTAKGMRCRNHPRWPETAQAPMTLKTPACFDQLPVCANEAAALKLVADRPLLFNGSCSPTPCMADGTSGQVPSGGGGAGSAAPRR